MEHYNKAHRKLNSFTLPWNVEERNSKVVELLMQAGYVFVSKQQWVNAGEAFVEANIYTDDNTIKINSLHEAAKAYKNFDEIKAVQTYQTLIKFLIENGDFYKTFKMFIEIAKIYDSIGYTENMIQNYKYAIQIQTDNNMSSLCSTVLTLAEKVPYNEAIQYYEQAIAISNELITGKYYVKQYMLNIILCNLYQDVQTNSYFNSNEASLKYSATYENSPEHTFSTALIKALEIQDEEKFTTIVKEYHTLKRLTDWQIEILVKIKRNIRDEIFNEVPEPDVPDYT